MRYGHDEPPARAGDAVANPEELTEFLESAENGEPPHESTATAEAAEALRSGRFPEPPPAPEVPGEDEVLRAGDPEVDPLENELSGEELPGATTPTPDQSEVDEVGDAYGLSRQEKDRLRLGAEAVEGNDAKRWELDPRSRDPKTGT